MWGVGQHYPVIRRKNAANEWPKLNTETQESIRAQASVPVSLPTRNRRIETPLLSYLSCAAIWGERTRSCMQSCHDGTGRRAAYILWYQIILSQECLAALTTKALHLASGRTLFPFLSLMTWILWSLFFFFNETFIYCQFQRNLGSIHSVREV